MSIIQIHQTAGEQSFQTVAPGVEIAFLRRHPGTGSSFLVRMAKGATAPLHDHPGGEETYLVSGKLRIEKRTDATGAPVPDAHLDAGDFLFAPPGEMHEGYAEEAALFFVMAPGGLARAERLAGQPRPGRTV
jgi:quercetin dioxygenase-like cupin family protein